MTNLKVVCIAILCCLSGNILGQYNNLGAWSSVTLNRKVAKDLDASLNTAVRWSEFESTPGNIFSDLGLAYKLHKKLSIGAAYRYSFKLQNDAYYLPRHRLALELNAGTKVGKVKIKYRIRYQMGSYYIHQSDGPAKSSTALRHKVGLESKLMKKTWIKLQSEWFTAYQQGMWTGTDLRLKLGITRKIKKRKYFSFGALFQTQLNNAQPTRDWVLYANYQIRLKKK